jgi:hypothetical protein
MVASKAVHRTPVDQVAARFGQLQASIDELTRRTATDSSNATCRIKLGTTQPLAAATEYWAGTGWIVGEDPGNNFTLSPGVGVYSYLTIPFTGRYRVDVRGVFTSPSAASTMTVFVARGGTDSALSIVRQNAESATYGTDGTIVHGSRSIMLNMSDRLFWGFWSYQACTLSTGVSNVPTEIFFTYTGSS